jgi:hypothetical protein
VLADNGEGIPSVARRFVRIQHSKFQILVTVAKVNMAEPFWQKKNRCENQLGKTKNQIGKTR